MSSSKEEPANLVDSPTTSISSAEKLLKESKAENSFQQLQQSAQKDRNRLSNMLDTYRRDNSEEAEDDADDFIVNKRDSGYLPSSTSIPQVQTDLYGSPKRKSIISTAQSAPPGSQSNAPFTTTSNIYPPSNDESFAFELEKPTITRSDSSSPVSYHTARNEGSSLSIDKRRSVISDYAPSIHEVNKFAYVEQVDKEVHDDQSLRPSVVMVSRSSSKLDKLKKQNSHGTGALPIDTQDAEIKSHEKNKDSVISNTTNTSSGSSKLTASTSSAKETQFNQSSPDIYKHIPTIEERKASTDSFTFDVGPLQTKKEEGVPQSSDRLSTTELDVAIPSRSPNRPISVGAIRSPLEKVKNHHELVGRKTKSVDVTNIDNLLDEIDSEIQKSPLVQRSSSANENAPENSELSKRELDKGNFESPSSVYPPESPSSTSQGDSQAVSLHHPRPLPPPPLPKHSAAPSISSKPDQKDDGFVTEDEEEPRGGDTSAESKKHKKHKKKNSKDKRKSVRNSSVFPKSGHFNHDTLVQLLQVTEGTIIGEEFQNIGLEPTDKQLLERLVDSLSRLTADMIIDSDRHDESVKRLNRAIKALEGF